MANDDTKMQYNIHLGRYFFIISRQYYFPAKRNEIHMDIFAKFEKRLGPIGDYAEKAPGYFAFPKLEGEISNRMKFRGKEKIVWSLNNYLGLANHPEVRKADAEAAKAYGLAWPMGARMMSGNSNNHEQLERDLAEFVGTEDAML